MVNPQESKPQAQRNWLIYCKGGRTMSTKWTFVHVVLLRYDEPYEKNQRTAEKVLDFLAADAYNIFCQSARGLSPMRWVRK